MIISEYYNELEYRYSKVKKNNIFNLEKIKYTEIKIHSIRLYLIILELLIK